MTWIAIFFGIAGRINRVTYWLAYLIWGAAVVLLDYIGSWIVEQDMTATQDRLFYIFTILIALGLVYSTFAIAVKRFHDRNKSGWWIVPLILIPSPPGDIVERFTGEPYGSIWSVVSGLVLTWTFVELGFLAGTAAPNRFGEVPPPSMAWLKQ